MSSVLLHISFPAHPSSPATASSAWHATAAQAALQLTDVAASHPNQKKVFTAIVTKPILLLLAQAIWPDHVPHMATAPTAQGQHSTAASDSRVSRHSTDGVRPKRHAERRLAVLLKLLLHKVIFHPSNTEGLLELSSSFGSQHGGRDDMKKSGVPRSYHFQLLQVRLCIH